MIGHYTTTPLGAVSRRGIEPHTRLAGTRKIANLTLLLSKVQVINSSKLLSIRTNLTQTRYYSAQLMMNMVCITRVALVSYGLQPFVALRDLMQEMRLLGFEPKPCAWKAPMLARLTPQTHKK